MKKTVLTFGLISGGILSIMMAGAWRFQGSIGFSEAEVIGYTTMVLSFLMVFFGIRSYRDSIGGKITFGKAFTAGILIMLIACVCYDITWEVLYFKFNNGFMDKYAAHIVEQAKVSGASDAAVAAQVEQMKKFKELYDNPLFNAAITFVEPFPVGLVMTLISAAVLRKKKAN